MVRLAPWVPWAPAGSAWSPSGPAPEARPAASERAAPGEGAEAWEPWARRLGRGRARRWSRLRAERRTRARLRPLSFPTANPANASSVITVFGHDRLRVDRVSECKLRERITTRS